ncbi:plastocyanin/azurin family copper-binding protein [Micromonospora sp. NPDC051006]|uniref:plastocyanin/azurin family copper-binding protein n=1 Tax=Micromonospora sp. NPDC051006 TaxID=3364283 RepID=UPI0037AE525C
MGAFKRRVMLVLAAGAGAALLLTSCGGGDSPTPNSTNSGTNSPAASPATTGTTVTATEKEYSITLSTTTFTPGAYTFEVVNQGTMSHNLTIKGPGVDAQASPNVQPGATGQVTVTLQQGSYELWCSLDNHKALGMDTTIQVG